MYTRKRPLFPAGIRNASSSNRFQFLTWNISFDRSFCFLGTLHFSPGSCVIYDRNHRSSFFHRPASFSTLAEPWGFFFGISRCCWFRGIRIICEFNTTLLQPRYSATIGNSVQIRYVIVLLRPADFTLRTGSLPLRSGVYPWFWTPLFYRRFRFFIKCLSSIHDSGGHGRQRLSLSRFMGGDVSCIIFSRCHRTSQTGNSLCGFFLFDHDPCGNGLYSDLLRHIFSK